MWTLGNGRAVSRAAEPRKSKQSIIFAYQVPWQPAMFSPQTVLILLSDVLQGVHETMTAENTSGVWHTLRVQHEHQDARRAL